MLKIENLDGNKYKKSRAKKLKRIENSKRLVFKRQIKATLIIQH